MGWIKRWIWGVSRPFRGKHYSRRRRAAQLTAFGKEVIVGGHLGRVMDEAEDGRLLVDFGGRVDWVRGEEAVLHYRREWQGYA